MIGAGELNRRVVFYKRVEDSRSALNEPVGRLVIFLIARARRRDVSDVEKMQAGRESTALQARFVVRSCPKVRRITAADRLTCDGLMWEIVGVKELDQGRNRFLEITAVTNRETDVQS
ncbi:phage head closure protein [Thalassococcus sp. S3]|uniref:phage head closure protein n=1 Tax=Thalassococcus sp. S3 TaxID=2017482 RepID=UPI00102445E8|nr:phage head closure protein [Thalassococcus sp. S3]QBF32148.1 phage head-tail joining protein [Thalassococcus sp. S3]